METEIRKPETGKSSPFFWFRSSLFYPLGTFGLCLRASVAKIPSIL